MRPSLVEALSAWPGARFLVPDYALMLSLAILAAVYLAVRRAPTRELDPRAVYAVALVTVAAAVLGARIHFALTHLDQFAGRSWEILLFWRNGLTSTGAVLGGFAGLVLAAYWRRLKLAPLLDLAAPSIALAIGLGRLACFLNGCCHGVVCTLPWAVRFPVGSGAYRAQLAAGTIAPGAEPVPVHPTQLYEAALALGLCFVLVRLGQKRLRPGVLFATFFTVYPIGRFLNEVLRGDSPTSFLFLTVPQVVSLAALALAAVFWIGRLRERMTDDDKPGLDSELSRC